ncbi:transporter substrate-binding domain-containing protein [Campylobacter insulaenigrae]|uniref:Amino acid ABC transporter, periplasmic amino acid-binding protein n=1 Tax=Campylobacter insulaenigrae NCTC 12927 TaxID=1031564 RepID=A0A0A8H2D3_9BACT|nr:transporter substrate-binding domain-containing protein [Campylobacter insulaenigrae]AJC87835.1 amino acid ABC transporter, periplasmic amino acid-binding protein [Campylobacter insulaenigrae NCTC 12927]VEH94220.1 glutamine-binding periplasmic protein [Campylobacter insulaenigrae]
MKKFLLLCLLFFSLNAKELIVGMELAYPPFEMSDAKGNPSGVSVDFLKEFAKENNYTLQIQNIAWDGLIPALRSKKIDLIMSSMSVSEQRKKVLDFTIPYAKANLAILSAKKSNINSIDDLNKKGKVIALKRGTSAHIYAQNNLSNAKILVFDKESAAILEVIQGKADGFIYDQMSIYKAWQKNSDQTKAIFTPFEEHPEQWAIALNKNNEKLKIELNNFIQKSKENGFFDDLAQKYLKDIQEIFKEQKLEFFF